MKRTLMRVPIIGPSILTLYRAGLLAKHHAGALGVSLGWLLRSREYTNFTYDLDNMNKEYLAALISLVTGRACAEIEAYFQELENDQEIKNHLANRIRASREGFGSDLTIRYGRRLGWYAFVRAMKPRVVVETGVDKGLGACVITSALLRNRREGDDGYYFGTDINPKAGWLLQGDYASCGRVLYGDSIKSLSELNSQIDLFINDSDHSADYEEREYRVIEPKLGPQAIVLGDNSHATDKLFRFAERTHRSFVFFKEQPAHHWYPGAGIGIAFLHNIAAIKT